ncbi:alpha/beta fold hydrolase [Diplocloster agilis]|uniref:alpha/beta fold hydrolase n=1 Tax=Diplocloster agilis TaxID=2850323 RepID=UPI0008234047|nr:alpha/beta fold hydrolase [Suonthocola fibrivorans]MCU6733565.1 acetylxylan esterase [Suonthocola fibrivorans]SCI98577.1 Cephalosporin C deacetylase [uncultured Clostridium sp.]
MGVFDLSVEQLNTYRGTNPKPRDFDEFWDRSVQEMKSIDPCVELKKSGFQTDFADCYDLFFTGMDRARIHAKYIKPRNGKEPHPAVLMFHGYTGNAGAWIEKLGYAANGFSVFAMDCRGQGGWSEDPGGVRGTTYRGQIIRGLDDGPEYLLFRKIFLDTAELAGIAMGMPEVDKDRVGVLGQSQGGGLTIACAALEPRIKRLAPLFPFLSDYQRVWELDLAKDSYEELSYYFRWFDPTHAREREIFETLGYIDVQNFAGRIKGRVLMGTGLMDTNCPPSTQFAFYNKLTGEKESILYPDFRHENIPDFNDKTFQFMRGL